MTAREQYARLLAPLLEQAAAYARSILRNRHNAEDAVQQAALRGLERIGTFDSSRPFKGWWFAILRNCCIDQIRSTKAANTQALDDYDSPVPTSHETDWEDLANALANLSSDHREILRLRYFADLSYAELADALAIPPGTVMSRLYLARKALAETMSKEHA